MNTKIFLVALTLSMVMANLIAQNNSQSEADLLGLPGDNLDLYATMDLFQGSKTIEEFEKSLNDEKTGINNLDLNLDGNADFIKVTTQEDGDDFVFVLQVDVLENETQDVAVILVSKDKEGNVDIQMIGDEELYGKNYVIEPKTETPAVTANPGYSGSDTVVVKSEPATVVVVESEPIVHYIYSPMYAPYYPPYYYGYYPPYFYPYPVISINIYFGRHRHHHHHYHGGHRGGNTIIINNNTTYNNYSRTKKTSNTVVNNRKDGHYKKNNVSKKPTDVNNKAKTNNPNGKVDSKEKVKNNKTNKAKSTAPSNKTKPTKRPSKPKGKRNKR